MKFYILFLIISYTAAYPEPGRFEYTFNTKLNNKLLTIDRTLFRNSHINIAVHCQSKTNILIKLLTGGCLQKCGNKTMVCINYEGAYNLSCNEHGASHKILAASALNPHNKLFINDTQNYLTTGQDGIYQFIFEFTKASNNFTAHVDITNWYGYLSGKDYPLLTFYSVMCGAYSIFALIWLILSCRNWRDLLRIQFWIGAVIFLGMLEKAMFVSEYQAINKTGVELKYPILIAEMVSCIKRMLARILLMIVCIGYGIVKQRLGPAMRKIIGVGFAYLLAALVEVYIRVLKPHAQESKFALIPLVVLVVLDALILWWSFSYLIQTIQQMRMKHNVVKFNLYRHFSNILIIVVIASAIFMTWALYVFKLSICQSHWKELWINEAFWHILFSIVLLTIMILWRPSKNSQRYAYSPLLDADDDMDDDEDNDVIMDNMTSGELRKPSKEVHQKKKIDRKTAEDDLKWIEDNIPVSAAEKIYPIVDSDSEITPSKLTAGKMD